MKTTWSKFKTDRLFLIKYYTIQFIITSVILYFMIKYIGFEKFTLNFSLFHLLLLPIGLILGIKIPVLMHNCVHKNLRPPILNIIAGELAGIYILMGLAAFELNHTMHHAYADSDLDPHNPNNKKFLPFFFANNFGGTKVVLRKYLQFFGDNRLNQTLFKLTIFMHFIAVPMRLTFWLLLLGPSLLITFFLPSYVFHMFVFSHINYVTHATDKDNQTIILNLNSNLYYKFVNFFGSGVYFHKNHHLNPGHYNPRQGASQSFLF